MQIYLVRHGETASNAARVVQTPETPLSERGVAQAEQLSARLAGEHIGAILSSTLCRATMTAERVGSVTGIPVTLRADLQERNYGDIRGTAYDDLAVSILDPDYEPPGGETWREFHQRVDGLWQHLMRRVSEAVPESGALVVVTHGLVLHSLVSRHLDLSRVSVVPIGFENTSVTVFEAEPPWTVTTLNCARHLEDGEGGAGGVV